MKRKKRFGFNILCFALFSLCLYACGGSSEDDSFLKGITCITNPFDPICRSSSYSQNSTLVSPLEKEINIAVVTAFPDQIDLLWSAPISEHEVYGYNIYRDGFYSETTTDTFYSDTSPVHEAIHCYIITAIDTEGYELVQSEEVCIMQYDI